MATYWKNGQKVQLESASISHAFSIAVSGSDVYCSGDYFGPVNSGRDTAVFWKNGKRTPLSPFTQRHCPIYLCLWLDSIYCRSGLG